MKELNKRAEGINSYGKYLGLTIGIVKNNADPMQHGRLQVYVPAYDAVDFQVEDLPWATYISPFGGVTAEFKVGPEQKDLPGISAYGFWAIPKNGAQVLIGCIDGNPGHRYYIGCMYQPEHNRTMPSGIDGVTSEIDESGAYGQHDFPHMQDRLELAGLWKSDPHFKTRGGYERSISHPSNKNKNKPTDNGYAPKPLEPEKADSQTVALTTPGRHTFLMSDVDEHCRVRIKTQSGNQVIFDDTNERIYISTGMGKCWLELDEGSGKIYIYSDSKISIRSKNDLNLYSDKNVNIVAKHRVNIQSEERGVKIQAHHNVDVLSTHANIKLSASRDMHLKTFDGPRAVPITFKELCVKPHSTPTGLNRDFEEEGGSKTSSIFIDAVDSSDYRVSRGALKVQANQRVDVKSANSKVNVQAASTLNLKADTDVNIDASTTLNLKAGGALNEQAAVINHDAATIIGRDYVGTFIGNHVDSSPGSPSGASSAEAAAVASPAKQAPELDVPPYMLKPDHESWLRDEDEPKCETPRNPKFVRPN